MTFAVGDRVLLSTENLRLAGTRKLNPRFIGPFPVVARVGRVAYKLELPAMYSALFPVFHVSKLRAYRDDGGDGGTEAVQPVLRDG